MTRLPRLLAAGLLAAGVVATTAAPASAGFCFTTDINSCFDGTPADKPWETAVYVACRIVSDGGGGC